MYEWLGFFLVATCGIVAALLASGTSLPREIKRLLLPAVLLRIVGSFLRYEILFRVYGGVGDAYGYFSMGVLYSDYIRHLDFSFLASENWWAGRWWGTQFLRYASGFVITVIGPSMRGEFLLFSFLSFVGLCLFGLAFHRAYPHLPSHRYLALLWLWPSLWFWPSSVGKDALLVLALGMITAGYVGKRERMSWILLFAGLLLATAIRPHVAGVAVVVMAGAQWLGAGKQKMTLSRLAQGVALAVLAVVVLQLALSQLGLAEADTEGVQEFMQMHAGLAQGGDSDISAPGGGWSQVPLAVVNILMRPFPWEAHNPQALVAALEMTFFWWLVWRRRRRIGGVLKQLRGDRFLRMAAPMVGVYVLMLGLVFGNLGIIARQRTAILPLLFLVLEAVPRDYIVRLKTRLERRRQQRQAAASGTRALYPGDLRAPRTEP